MNHDKDTQSEQASNLNKKRNKAEKGNDKVKNIDSVETNTEDLKLKNKISVNIHTKPAEEQQFENNS